MTCASAPGKLLLFGEYAVLEGAEAVVAAVDRRATVELRAAPAGTGSLLQAPQISSDPVPFAYRDGVVRWRCEREVAVRLELASHLVGDLLADRTAGGGPEREPLSARIDTASFFDGPRKLGLGSSAAMTVAWLRAARRSIGVHELFRRGLALHRAFQGGRGSGADVAASAYGGLLAYRRSRSLPARPLVLPGGLSWGAVWTGRSADTRDFLRRLGAWQEAEPARYDRAMGRLLAATEEAVRALESGAVGRILEAARASHRALEGLGQRAGLPIVSPIHSTLACRAEVLGLAYKPSGAGGGDFGLVFGSDPERLGDFTVEAERVGTTLVPLSIDDRGAALEADPQS